MDGDTGGTVNVNFDLENAEHASIASSSETDVAVGVPVKSFRGEVVCRRTPVSPVIYIVSTQTDFCDAFNCSINCTHGIDLITCSLQFVIHMLSDISPFLGNTFQLN